MLGEQKHNPSAYAGAENYAQRICLSFPIYNGR